MERPVFIIRPCEDGLYELSGPLLPYPLRYANEAFAVGYAHHRARITGAVVLVINRRGDVEFSERSAPLNCATGTW